MPFSTQALTKSIQKLLHMLEKLCLQMDFLMPCHELTAVMGKRMSKDYSFFGLLKTPFQVVSFQFSDEISLTVKQLFKHVSGIRTPSFGHPRRNSLVCSQFADGVHANLNVCFQRLPETDTTSLLSLLIRGAKRNQKRKIPDQTGLNLA